MPEIVFAVAALEARRHLAAMEEVAHDSVGRRPVVPVHAMMMRAQPAAAGELKAACRAKAHAEGHSEGRAKPQTGSCAARELT